MSDGGANRVPRDSKFTTLCVLAYSIRQAKLNHQVHVSVAIRAASSSNTVKYWLKSDMNSFFNSKSTKTGHNSYA